MLTLVLVVVLVLLSSALCSGAEASLFSISLVKAKGLAKEKRSGSSALLKIKENMNRHIATIVVLNNIANIIGSIIVGKIAGNVLGNQWLGVFSSVLTFLVIIFSEIIPKTLGERYADKIALAVARPVVLLSLIFTPILWLIEKVTLPITGSDTQQFTTNEAEIKLLASIGEKEGIIEHKESTLIQKAFELNNTTAKELMTPRVVLTYIDGHSSLEETKEQIINSEHSRILIADKTPDIILGVARKDFLLGELLNGKGPSPLQEFAQPVHQIKESTTAEKLLNLFQKSRQHIGVVYDEYGGVSGVVTLEDVIEILTGEIVDETDKDIDLQKVAKLKFKKTKS